MTGRWIICENLKQMNSGIYKKKPQQKISMNLSWVIIGIEKIFIPRALFLPSSLEQPTRSKLFIYNTQQLAPCAWDTHIHRRWFTGLTAQRKKTSLVVKNTSANAGDVKRCSFSPWVGKITWSGDWLPTAVFSPRESHGQRKPGRLEAIGLQGLGHDWSNLACMPASTDSWVVQFLWGRSITGYWK